MFLIYWIFSLLTEECSHRFARIESVPMGVHISRHRYICHYIIPFFPFVHWRNPEIGKRKIHGLFFGGGSLVHFHWRNSKTYRRRLVLRRWTCVGLWRKPCYCLTRRVLQKLHRPYLDCRSEPKSWQSITWSSWMIWHGTIFFVGGAF